MATKVKSKTLSELNDEELASLAKQTSSIIQEANIQYAAIRDETHRRKAMSKVTDILSKLTPAEKLALTTLQMKGNEDGSINDAKSNS